MLRAVASRLSKEVPDDTLIISISMNDETEYLRGQDAETSSV